MLERIYHLFRLKSLKSRLRFWFTILLLLLVVLSYISFAKYAREFREIEAQNNINQMINLQQMMIENWLDEKSTTIQSISQLPVVRTINKEKITEVLELYDQNYAEFDGLTFVNAEGVSEIDTSGPIGIQLSDRIYFHEGKKGKSYITDVLIGRQSHQPIIIFSSPVFDYDQQFQGVVFGAVRLNTVNNVMKKFNLNETGQTYLVNRKGHLISGLRFPSQFIGQEAKDGMTGKMNSNIIQLALQGKPITQIYKDYRGVNVFGDYRWVNDKRWLIIGEISENEIFAPFIRMVKIFSVVLGIVFLIGFMITFFISNRIERILHQILDGAAAIGRAKFGYRINLTLYTNYSHEFQGLCRSFNQMAEMIQYHMHSVQESENRYRALIESSPNAIIVHQKDKIVYANPNCVRLIKAQSLEDLLGRNIIEFVHPDYHEIVLKRIVQLEKNQQVGLIEEKYVLMDGSTINVEVVATPIVYMGESAFQVIINDISERKAMEKELQKSQVQCGLIAEYSSDMITFQDKTGKFLYVSPACEEILQYGQDELIGQYVRTLIHPDDLEYVQEKHSALLEAGYVVATYRMRRKNGEYIWLESSIRLLQSTEFDDSKFIVITRNIHKRKLAEQKLREANELFQRLSSIDGLTGIANRRTFDERLEVEWKRSLRNSTPLSLIMFDIDYFKKYNDTYGHLGGDGCLKQVATTIQETLGRASDLLCRYGGEEFSVILPETDEIGAYTVGEKIRNAIEELQIPHAGSTISDWVTISVGTATIMPTLYMEPTNLMTSADKAVYEAKKAGRNCVRSYE